MRRRGALTAGLISPFSILDEGDHAETDVETQLDQSTEAQLRQIFEAQRGLGRMSSRAPRKSSRYPTDPDRSSGMKTSYDDGWYEDELDDDLDGVGQDDSQPVSYEGTTVQFGALTHYCQACSPPLPQPPPPPPLPPCPHPVPGPRPLSRGLTAPTAAVVHAGFDSDTCVCALGCAPGG